MCNLSKSGVSVLCIAPYLLSPILTAILSVRSDVNEIIEALNAYFLSFVKAPIFWNPFKSPAVAPSSSSVTTIRKILHV